MRLGKVDSTHVIKRVNSVTAEMVIQSLRYGIKAWLKMDPVCIKKLLDQRFSLSQISNVCGEDCDIEPFGRNSRFCWGEFNGYHVDDFLDES